MNNENPLTEIKDQINTTKKNVDLISNCVDYIDVFINKKEFGE